jgi:serine/threonine-protein kinase PpkA
MIRLINRSKIIFLTITAMVYLTIIWVDVAASQNCKPLLLTGKKTLFQRVISNPGANVYVSADKTSPIVQASVKPFTIFYVYEHRQVEGAEWLKVGPSASCEISGWVEGSLVSEWRQSLSLVFTERVGRQPVLFF